MPDYMTTGAAARILGVATDTVRWYHRIGRLQAKRTSSGLRLFDRRDVEALAEKRRQSARVMSEVVDVA